MKKFFTFILVCVLVFGAYWVGANGFESLSFIPEKISEVIDSFLSKELVVKMDDDVCLTFTYGVKESDIKKKISKNYTTNGKVSYSEISTNVGTTDVNLTFVKGEEKIEKSVKVIIEQDINSIKFKVVGHAIYKGRLILQFEVTNNSGSAIKGFEQLNITCYDASETVIASAAFYSVNFGYLGNEETKSWGFTFPSDCYDASFFSDIMTEEFSYYSEYTLL